MTRATRLAVAVLATAVLGTGCRSDVPVVGVVMGKDMEELVRSSAAAPGPGPVELEFRNAGTPSADGALAAARDVVSQGAVAVIGHSNSAASLAASQVYNGAGVVQIAPSTTATVYDRAGEYSFRLVPSDRHQARLLLEEARALADGRPIVVLYDNDAYGFGLFRDLTVAADSAGVSLAAAGGFVSGDAPRELEELTLALLRPQPRTLIWIGRAPDLRPLLPLLRERGVQVVASDGVDSGFLRGDLETFAGIYLVRLLDCPVLQAAAARLKDRLDLTGLGAEGLLTYDALGLVRSAVASGARSGDEIRDYLLSLGHSRPPFEGLTGPISFDGNRSVERAWRLARIVGDSIASVEVGR